MSAPGVFVVNRDLAELLPALRARFPGVRFDGADDPGRFPEGILDCEVLAGWVLRPEWLPRLPNLKWVHCTGAGVDRIVSTPGLPADVAITRSHGNFDRQMSEFVLAAVYHHAAGWPAWQAQQAARQWLRPRRSLAADKRVGVMGLGAIGGAVAGLLAASGMRVHGWSRSGEPHPACERVFPERALDEFLPGLDYLAVVVPLTPATRGALDGPRLRLMKQGAVLINVARAAVVEEPALAEALEAGRLSAAYLDVLWTEPLPADDPWWTRRGAFLTPHIAGMTLPGDLVNELSLNLERWLSDRPLQGRVDRARGY